MNLGFILSTGRTGTQFFESYISETSSSLCLHEPKPSRRFKFLSNAYLNNQVKSQWICRAFKYSRNKIIRKLGPEQNYIESNNFAFGCIKALNQCYSDIKILHIIRNPLDYVQSHLNHGFWVGHKRFFAQYIPFWLESVDPKKYYRNDPLALLLLRWIYVNKVIFSYKEDNIYLRVRFEDVFNDKMENRLNKINEIRLFFNLEEINKEKNLEVLSKRRNFSKRVIKFELKPEHYRILNEAGDLIRKFDYEFDGFNVYKS